MNKTITVFSILLLFDSCSGEQATNRSDVSTVKVEEDTVEESPQDEPSELKVDTTKQCFQYRDTILSHNYKFQMDFMGWTIDEIDLSPYPNIERIEDTLIFRAEKSTVTLVNEEYIEEKQNFEAPRYSFVKFHEQANIAVVQVQVYEYSYHVLVDMFSGDTIITYGKPLFNKNNSLLFASNVDLDVQYTENGFQLIKKDSNGFKLLNTTILSDWAVAKASWIGKNRILISKAIIDDKYDMHYKTGVLTLDVVGM